MVTDATRGCPVDAPFDPLSATYRWPGLRLVPGQRLTFHPNISFRGPQQLWVRVAP